MTGSKHSPTVKGNQFSSNVGVSPVSNPYLAFFNISPAQMNPGFSKPHPHTGLSRSASRRVLAIAFGYIGCGNFYFERASCINNREPIDKHINLLSCFGVCSCSPGSGELMDI